MTALDLTRQCDATASGTEAAQFVWMLADGIDMLPMELTFCAHHNGVHRAALKLAGWSPVPATILEQSPETVNA